jgi:large subunit ribosomal protein L29
VKTGEIRAMDETSLKAALRDLEEELFRLRLRNATHQLESPIQVRRVRRDIARCRTILKERQANG